MKHFPRDERTEWTNFIFSLKKIVALDKIVSLSALQHFGHISRTVLIFTDWFFQNAHSSFQTLLVQVV